MDGSVPGDGSFSVLATRSLDPDQETTYYTDSSGGSAYWYKHTYFNETTLEETSLAAANAVRGDDYSHYASLTDIRREAGFLEAHNLSDVTVDQQRRAAEAEINAKLGGTYATPFSPIPEMVRTLTIQLAAGLLLIQAYGQDSTRGKELLKQVRGELMRLQDGDLDLPSSEAASIRGDDVASWPNDSTATAPVEDGGGERLFRIGDVY
ncbi:MAG: phage protein Gp36 family protein [Ornithinimicrobium sp.]